MSYRKKTLRVLPNSTRQLARQADSLASLAKSIKRRIYDFAALEHAATALANHRCHQFPWLTIEQAEWRLDDLPTRKSAKPSDNGGGGGLLT